MAPAPELLVFMSVATASEVSFFQAPAPTSSGVRGGGAGVSAAPRLEKFRANSVFRASSSCSKILKDKKYLNTVKNFRANSCFQGKHKLLKNPE